MAGRGFRADKALEVILYIVSQGCTNMYNVLKVIYFADKEHLRMSGCTMFKDRYIAMKAGAVPSGARDIVNLLHERNSFNARFGYLNVHDALKFCDEYNLKALREFNPDFFSDADYIGLDYAIKKYGQMPFSELMNVSHDCTDYIDSDRNDEISFEKLVESVDADNKLRDFIECINGAAI